MLSMFLTKNARTIDTGPRMKHFIIALNQGVEHWQPFEPHKSQDIIHLNKHTFPSHLLVVQIPLFSLQERTCSERVRARGPLPAGDASTAAVSDFCESSDMRGALRPRCDWPWLPVNGQAPTLGREQERDCPLLLQRPESTATMASTDVGPDVHRK